LEKADLTRADLAITYLYYVNLAGANMTEADPGWAGLYETNFINANLTRARYSRHTYHLEAQLSEKQKNSIELAE